MGLSNKSRTQWGQSSVICGLRISREPFKPFCFLSSSVWHLPGRSVASSSLSASPNATQTPASLGGALFHSSKGDLYKVSDCALFTMAGSSSLALGASGRDRDGGKGSRGRTITAESPSMSWHDAPQLWSLLHALINDSWKVLSKLLAKKRWEGVWIKVLGPPRAAKVVPAQRIDFFFFFLLAQSWVGDFGNEACPILPAWRPAGKETADGVWLLLSRSQTHTWTHVQKKPFV